MDREPTIKDAPGGDRVDLRQMTRDVWVIVYADPYGWIEIMVRSDDPWGTIWVKHEKSDAVLDDGLPDTWGPQRFECA